MTPAHTYVYKGEMPTDWNCMDCHHYQRPNKQGQTIKAWRKKQYCLHPDCKCKGGKGKQIPHYIATEDTHPRWCPMEEDSGTQNNLQKQR